ncbi:FAD-binding protein [Candidatus Pelagibacter sp.]|nr:FAD-binding protein [Candidatus Pelagibacter sp.]
MAKHKTHYEECDVLVVGGGMAGTGATFEARHWGRDLKIICVEKANIDRSGAVAQGLYAINCYMGMQWDENQPEDHVRYARNDLMGLVREDLGYDMARHVDSTVHMFDEWGLPMMKNEKTGRYLREGKWQIMIHGESVSLKSLVFFSLINSVGFLLLSELRILLVASTISFME